MRMTSKNYSLFLIITVIQLRGLISSCSNLDWASGTLSPGGRYPRLGPGVTWRGMPTRLCQALWRTLLLGEEEKLHTIFGTSRSRAFLRRCCFPSAPRSCLLSLLCFLLTHPGCCITRAITGRKGRQDIILLDTNTYRSYSGVIPLPITR